MRDKQIIWMILFILVAGSALLKNLQQDDRLDNLEQRCVQK